VEDETGVDLEGNEEEEPKEKVTLFDQHYFNVRSMFDLY